MGSFEFFSVWTNINYVNFAQAYAIASASTWDEMFIAIDDSGASGGVDDYITIAGANYGADLYRSATANTAISNLVGKGWTIVR